MESLLSSRTISHILKIFVLPEIEKRVKNGTLKESNLPLELDQFRAIQRNLPDGSILPIVELNDEVNIVAKVKVKRAVSAGEPLTLNDIYPEECFISLPVYDGKPAAYFLCQSMFLNWLLIFDCQSNAPGISEAELEGLKESEIHYPILDFINAKNFREVVKPVEKLKILSDNNWPPAPGYSPLTIAYMHGNPANIRDKVFLDVVAASFNRDYWKLRLAFWEETNFFPNRLQYLRKAIDTHFQDDFICSIYVVVPQFEGIIKDYLTTCGKTPPNGFAGCVRELKKLVLSRKVLMFPREVLETIFGYLEVGSFWGKNTGAISDPSEEVNRHGIAHGVFTGFECKSISLKYLILLDSLSFVLLHDRMLTGSL